MNLTTEIEYAKSYFAPHLDNTMKVAPAITDDEIKNLHCDPQGLLVCMNFAQNMPSSALDEAKEAQNIADLYSNILLRWYSTHKKELGDAFDGKKVLSDAFDHLPGLSNFVFETKTIHQASSDTTIAGDLIKLITDSFSPAGVTLDSFKVFLTNLGEKIALQAADCHEYFSTQAVVTVLNYDGIGIVPIQKIYSVDFKEDNVLLSAPCVSHTDFNISFDYFEITATLSRECYTNPILLEKYHELILKYYSREIENIELIFKNELDEYVI